MPNITFTANGGEEKPQNAQAFATQTTDLCNEDFSAHLHLCSFS